MRLPEIEARMKPPWTCTLSLLHRLSKVMVKFSLEKRKLVSWMEVGYQCKIMIGCYKYFNHTL